MSDKPNVTVIYQDVPAKGPTCAQVIVEGLAFLALVGVVAILGLWR